MTGIVISSRHHDISSPYNHLTLAFVWSHVHVGLSSPEEYMRGDQSNEFEDAETETLHSPEETAVPGKNSLQVCCHEQLLHALCHLSHYLQYTAALRCIGDPNIMHVCGKVIVSQLFKSIIYCRTWPQLTKCRFGPTLLGDCYHHHWEIQSLSVDIAKQVYSLVSPNKWTQM